MPTWAWVTIGCAVIGGGGYALWDWWLLRQERRRRDEAGRRRALDRHQNGSER